MSRLEKFDAPGDSSDTAQQKRNARAALGDRLRFLCHQATFLSAQIPDQVASIEHALVSLAYEDFDDLAAAEASQVRALSVATAAREKALASRTLARLRFMTQRVQEGRKDFQAAVTLLSEPVTDEDLDELAETFLRWAETERWFGEPTKALALLDRALAAARGISSVPRRGSALANIDQRGQPLRAAIATALTRPASAAGPAAPKQSDV